MSLPLPVDVVVIGAGPAGTAAARLLASWGHTVVLLDKGADRSRGLAESIPPSTSKLLSEIGVLGDVERAGFVRASGNTVWWASQRARVERFHSAGFQVFRPDFDRVMVNAAAIAGARIESHARVRTVTFGGELARIHYDQRGRQSTVAARFVLDCSGRAGVVGRWYRKPQHDHRTCALVGVWQTETGWCLPDTTHTVVETFTDGWSWSVPTSPTLRHVGAMVASPAPAFGRRGGDALTRMYRAQIAKSRQQAHVVSDATLKRVWACDASLYYSETYAGPQFLLVGDAGSFIDPLSSFGVKKALASAWLASVALHTALAHTDRASMAVDYFSNWERRVYATHLRRSTEFARTAYEAHRHPFWSARAMTSVEEVSGDDGGSVAFGGEVQRLFERFRTAPHINLVLSDGVRFEQRPVVRGREIVAEPALEGGLRFVANVDLVKLARIASQHRYVPDLFDAYCRTSPPVPLPSVVGGLSLLVARGILHERT